MNQRHYVLAMLVVALVMSGRCANYIQPFFNVSEQLKGEEIESAKESIALSLLGQVQFTVGSMVWLKTLEYLHNGVPYRMPTNAEEEHGQRASNSSGTIDALAHQEGVSMTLSPKTDWRGIVGELHREIYPYMAEHNHSDPRELIPWYRLVTRFNPNLERLFVMGAFFMSDFAKEPDEALAYLEEGAKANPWSFEIHAALGRLYFDNFSDYEKAYKALQKATEYGVAEQERLTRNKEHFDDYQKQLFKESFLFLAKSMMELKQYDEALKVCDRGYAATNANQLNVQRRIIEKRMRGEAVPSDKTELVGTPSPVNNKSGIREKSVREEEDEAEPDSIDDFETDHSWKYAVVVCFSLFVLLGVILYGYRKGKRGLWHHCAKKNLLYILIGIGISFVATAIYIVWPEKIPVFVSEKDEAGYYRTKIDERTVRLSSKLLQAGKRAWELAEAAEKSGDVEGARKCYYMAAKDYRTAVVVAKTIQKERTLNFPENKSMGKISIRPWGKQKPWEKIGEAKGPIKIPAGHEVNLDMEGHIIPEDIDRIAELGDSTIQSLNIDDDQLDEEVLKHVQTGLCLRDLSLYGTNTTDAGLNIVSQMNSLETLNMGETKVTDAGLSVLSQLPVLEKLSLAHTNISDFGIAYLGQVPTLKSLWLTGNKTDIKGLVHLKEMKNLRLLWLGNLPGIIDDSACPYFEQMTFLKELWIGDKILSEQGLNTLRNKLPNCRILD